MTAETGRHLIGFIILIIFAIAIICYIDSVFNDGKFWEDFEAYMKVVGIIAILAFAVALITL